MIKLKPHLKIAGETALAIGLFDGLHRGHQALLSAISSHAHRAILTFNSLDKSEKHGRGELLTTLEDREEYAAELGFDTIFYLDFDSRVKNMAAADFVSEYLSDLKLSAIAVGEDFRFGRGAAGDANTLKLLLPEVEVIVVPTVCYHGLKISTTDIIKMIQQGDIETAQSELTRPYRVRGSVRHGLHNGKRLGFPTANLALSSPYVLPRNGVYATKIEIGGRRYLSMTNIGNHPTITPLPTPSIEVNIFDFKGDIYGREVKLSFLEYLRDEKKFDSEEELKAELSRNKQFISDKYMA